MTYLCLTFTRIRCSGYSLLTTHTSSNWEKENAIEEWFPSDWPQQICGNIFLIANWYKRARPTVGSAIPVQIGLTCIRKVDEQVRGRNPVSSITQWFCFSSSFQAPAMSFVHDGWWPGSFMKHGAGEIAETSTSGSTGSRRREREPWVWLRFLKAQRPCPVTWHTSSSKAMLPNPFR